MILKRFIRTIHLLTALVLFVFSIVFVLSVGKLNIVPNNYYWMLCGAIALVVLMFEFVLLKKSKKVFMQIIKGIVFIICILLFWVYGFVLNYADRTKSVLSSFIAKNEEVQAYYFMSNNINGYSEISDLEGKRVGYFIRLDENVKSKIKINITYELYTDSQAMFDDLKNNKIDAIIITDLLMNDYEEMVASDTENSYSKIETITVTTKIENITKRVSIKNTPFSILISGSDSRNDDINAVGNNDVNIIVTINPNTNEILIISVPRDFYVQLHGTTGDKDKLTHASYYGINMHVQTLEDLFDTEINYYVKVNFNTVIKLVDSIGGIDLYSDKAYYKGEGCTYVLGMNHLDGKCALAFSRERYVYKGGDRHRVQNQVDVIKAVFTKLKNGGSLVYNYMDILEAIEGEFLTNMPIDEATNFIKFELNDISKYEVYNYQVDGTNAMDYTYSYPNQKLYVMVPKQETVDHAKELLNAIKNGESVKDLME